MPGWDEHAKREESRYRDGESRLPDAADPDARQRQVTRMGNAAWGAGLAHLMAGDGEAARSWLDLAARRYRESWEGAPPTSWGRPIAAMKARLLAGDDAGAAEEARWALSLGAATSDSPIGRYAAALANAVLGDWHETRFHADWIRTHDDFPAEVGDGLAFVAAEDVIGYIAAVETVLESFEQRDEYLEDVPVADTVLVLQRLAERRGMAAELESDLLPPAAG